jgi:kynureninase
MTHQGGYAIVQAVIKRDVIGDFRRLNVFSCGFAPLYNSSRDIRFFLFQRNEIVDSKIYLSPEFATEIRMI